MAKKNKIKYIFECTAPENLTEFNREWNQKVYDHCERPTKFEPALTCADYHFSDEPCKYLKIHTYKGEK